MRYHCYTLSHLLERGETALSLAFRDKRDGQVAQ